MGEGFGSLFSGQQFDWQSPNLNYSDAALHTELQNTIPWHRNPGTSMVSANGTLPVYPFHRLPHLSVGQLSEYHGWFYCLPCFRQGFMPAMNSVLKEKPCSASHDKFKEAMTPKAESGCAQKRFLVFDQSGDQTTLIFSSGVGTPVQCLTSWSPKPTNGYNSNQEDAGTNENANFPLGPIPNAEVGENNGTNVQSEMHEDTEELNALLYSDDDSDYTEDDEVTSTGHSPSTMTAHEKQDWVDGSTEEVASTDGSTKKRKLFDGSFKDVLTDTASSVKRIRGFEYDDDDAESKCVHGVNSSAGGTSYEFGNKRIRKERIRETVSILQNIIPNVKGKEAAVVLDEAISYLKSLKLKVKALGLDAP